MESFDRSALIAATMRKWEKRIKSAIKEAVDDAEFEAELEIFPSLNLSEENNVEAMKTYAKQAVDFSAEHGLTIVQGDTRKVIESAEDIEINAKEVLRLFILWF